jgi:MFS transporter, PHS family, inorganic phosphate transporter
MTTLFGTSAGAKAMLFLFFLAGFFTNFGANTTTFIISGELFPARYRLTCHGISAASGKLGAIVGQFAIIQMVSQPFIV